MEQQTLILPDEIISPTDIARLVRETENLDEFFRQSAIHEGGTQQSAPRYSRLLDVVVVANELDLLQSSDRENLLATMKDIAKNAPVVHISFSVEPPNHYVQQIVTWLRANIDGRILVSIGLQPSIGAGCVVRTTNQSFDFSLRRFFDSKKDFFAQKLHEVVGADNTAPLQSPVFSAEQADESQPIATPQASDAVEEFATVKDDLSQPIGVTAKNESGPSVQAAQQINITS
jgi:F0F1-type ATP synthase delta subunit